MHLRQDLCEPSREVMRLKPRFGWIKGWRWRGLLSRMEGDCSWDSQKIMNVVNQEDFDRGMAILICLGIKSVKGDIRCYK